MEVAGIYGTLAVLQAELLYRHSQYETIEALLQETNKHIESAMVTLKAAITYREE